MSDISISRTLFSYVIDPQVVGYDLSIFTTTSGTPSVSSNKYRWNASGSRLDYQLLFGEVTIPLTIPTAPTTGHSRRIGFKTYGPSGKGSVYFDITDAVLSAKVVTNAGTTYTEVIPWNSAWTNAETFFRISWDEKMANFSVGSGSNIARVAVVVAAQELLNIPAFFVVESTVADNMDASYIQILNAARVATLSSSGNITEVTPGTAASNLGKAEDAAHTSGDTGVAVWSVRKDTAGALAGSEGDYAPVITDANNLLWVNDGTLKSGENQTNNALGTFRKFYNSTNQKPVSVTYTSFTTQAIASSVPLTLVDVRVVNTTASPRYLYMNNASSIAGAAAPSITPLLVPASGSSGLNPDDFGGNGEVFSTALTIGNSSTAATFTAGSAGDLIVTLHYVTAMS